MDPDQPHYYPNNVLETLIKPLPTNYIPKFTNKLPKSRKEWVLFLNKLLPLTTWLPQYNFKSYDIFSDLLASLTITVIIIPQGMAYATLAGLPVQYGLYSAVIPPLVYAIFGTSRECSVGITAVSYLYNI